MLCLSDMGYCILSMPAFSMEVCEVMSLRAGKTTHPSWQGR